MIYKAQHYGKESTNYESYLEINYLSSRAGHGSYCDMHLFKGAHCRHKNIYMNLAFQSKNLAFEQTNDIFVEIINCSC